MKLLFYDTDYDSGFKFIRLEYFYDETGCDFLRYNSMRSGIIYGGLSAWNLLT